MALGKRLVRIWFAGLLFCSACGSGAVGPVEQEVSSLPDADGQVEVNLQEIREPDLPRWELLPWDGEVGGEISVNHGDWGKPCASNADCESSFCLEVSENESVCTINCVEECPKDWLCKGIESPPDWVFVCVPPGGSFCSACQEEEDCPFKGDSCLPVGDTGTYCLSDCAQGQACPANTLCQALPEGGPPGEFCLPATGSCVCDAATNGTARVCVLDNEFGKCFGEEVCDGPAGWSGCDAQVPGLEICDGYDQDCDGEVDEGLAATPCTSSNEFGECSGIRTCKGKDGWLCDASIPEQEFCDGKDNDCDGEIDEDYLEEQESCDGKDNDCDGLVDEGFADTDNDSEADCLDADDDNDGILDESDNCPLIKNPGQADLDGDLEGDLCDADIDGDGAENALDCAPYDGQVHVGAQEICNGQDDNCNGQIDEGYPDTDQDQQANCMDLDDDGDGDPDLTDCAPLNPAIFTGAEEVCDGMDNDCNGMGDENCPAASWTLSVTQGAGNSGGDGGKIELLLPVGPSSKTSSGADLKVRWGM